MKPHLTAFVIQLYKSVGFTLNEECYKLKQVKDSKENGYFEMYDVKWHYQEEKTPDNQEAINAVIKASYANLISIQNMYVSQGLDAIDEFFDDFKTLVYIVMDYRLNLQNNIFPKTPWRQLLGIKGLQQST